MTRLRMKMLEDMQLRGLSKGTAVHYVSCVKAFAKFFNRSPDALGTAEVRRFLLRLVERGLAPATRVVYHSALKFIYDHTLGRAEVMATIPRPRVPRRPEGRALTQSESRALLDCLAPRPFDYTFFAFMLATGFRISEAVALQVHDIDRCAGLIHVRKGKGDKARSVMLSPRTLRLLERHWTVNKPRAPFVFPAQRLIAPGRVDPHNRWADHPVGKGTMSQRLQKAQPNARRRVRSHDLRRTFGTSLIAQGYDLRRVQVLLGHASPETTARYTSINAELIAQTTSPYDLL